MLGVVCVSGARLAIRSTRYACNRAARSLVPPMYQRLGEVNANSRWRRLVSTTAATSPPPSMANVMVWDSLTRSHLPLTTANRTRNGVDVPAVLTWFVISSLSLLVESVPPSV
jgi:hypothetical protein